MKCPTCAKPFHKGKRLHVLLETGDLVVRVVCGACFRRSLRVVAMSRGFPCRQCKPGEARDATHCGDCVNEAVHKAVVVCLQPFIDSLESKAKAYRLDNNPLHHGLTMAAELLRVART